MGNNKSKLNNKRPKLFSKGQQHNVICISKEKQTYQASGVLGSAKNAAYTIRFTSGNDEIDDSNYLPELSLGDFDADLTNSRQPKKRKLAKLLKFRRKFDETSDRSDSDGELSQNIQREETSSTPVTFSTGLHFYTKASVRRIPCDQLHPFNVHKERAYSNQERRFSVLRKLYKDGGWIRIGHHKRRAYVQAGTPFPDILLVHNRNGYFSLETVSISNFSKASTIT